MLFTPQTRKWEAYLHPHSSFHTAKVKERKSDEGGEVWINKVEKEWKRGTIERGEWRREVSCLDYYLKNATRRRENNIVNKKNNSAGWQCVDGENHEMSGERKDADYLLREIKRKSTRRKGGREERARSQEGRLGDSTKS